jgi:hypothetical protein
MVATDGPSLTAGAGRRQFQSAGKLTDVGIVRKLCHPAG